MAAPLVRAATAADAAAIQCIYAPAVSESAASFEQTPPDAAEMARRMQARPHLPWLVAEVDGSVAGYAYASAHRQRAAYRWSAECSIFVDRTHQRRGVGRVLYTRLLDEVRGIGYVSLYAGIVLPNSASVALHESVGFEPVGVYRNAGYKAGAWRDVGWWQLTLTDPPARPAEPSVWAAGEPRCAR